MRDDLIRVLVEQAGIDETTAERAAEAVIDYLRDNGPEVMRSEELGWGDIGGVFGR
jgi:hypothetical protein